MMKNFYGRWLGMRAFAALAAVMVALTAMAYSPSGSLPVLYINVDNGATIESREDYLWADYWVDPMGDSSVEALGSAESPLRMEIRGRGNYTWTGFNKKPYRIKLETKQPLLGMEKSRHFALLAHADDRVGFMRNIVGFQMSRLIGLTWTPNDVPCELVLNGEYCGLYFLTETVRIAKSRVNIFEMADLATDDVTGGWLVEIDNYNDDPHITLDDPTSSNGQMWFTYKSPEVLSPEQENYLRTEMQQIHSRLYDLPVDDDSWEETVDVNELARFYVVQEIVDNYESFHGSCYLHKDAGETEWRFGPVWDFGCSFQRSGKGSLVAVSTEFTQHWIGRMVAHNHFQGIVEDTFNDFVENGSFSDIYSYIDAYAERIRQGVGSDAQRWSDYGNPDFDSDIAYIKNFLKGSVVWLNARWNLNEDLYYVVGSFNNWGGSLDESSRLKKVTDNVYGAYLPKLSKEFKINDGSWVGAVNFGAKEGTDPTLNLDVPFHYFNGASNNIVVNADESELTNVYVELNLDEGTITVSKSGQGTPDPSEGNVMVYFDNSETQWAQVYCYVWYQDESGTVVNALGGWPGKAATKVNDGVHTNLYSVEMPFETVPSGAQIIFSDGQGGTKGVNQTYDLPLVAGKTYTIAGISAVEVIGQDATRVKVMCDGHTVYIEAPAAMDIPITGISGRTLRRHIDAGINAIDNLPSGFYVIAGTKVIVR